jgi:hypothetical protein
VTGSQFQRLAVIVSVSDSDPDGGGGLIVGLYGYSADVP